MGKIKKVVEEQMCIDDETTAHNLHKMLMSKGYSVSLSTILQCQIRLDGHLEGARTCTASSFAMPVKLNVWSGLLAICTATRPSKTLYLRMNVA